MGDVALRGLGIVMPALGTSGQQRIRISRTRITARAPLVDIVRIMIIIILRNPNLTIAKLVRAQY